MKIISTLLWIGALVTIYMSPGCSDNSDVTERLKSTIRDIKQYGGGSFDDLLLKALQKATPQTLQTPELVYVSVSGITRSTPNIRLWLYWIEAKSTPDAVLVRNAESGYQKIFAFDELYFKENKRLNEIGVLFHFVHAFEPESDIWKSFRTQIANGNAEAVLLRDGKQVSNVVKVHLWPA